jgi:hypothetical protein
MVEQAETHLRVAVPIEEEEDLVKKGHLLCLLFQPA